MAFISVSKVDPSQALKGIMMQGATESTKTYSYDYEPPYAKKLKVDKCFHGFSVDATPPQCKLFKIKDELGRGRNGIVFDSLCPNGCNIAIKVVDLSDVESKKSADREKHCFEYLKDHYHENLVEFFGCFDEDDKRYFCIEKGDICFSKLFEEEGKNLTLNQFYEIAHQLLKIVKHFNKIGVLWVDLSTKNMIFCKRQGKIKAIDFASVKVPNDKDQRSPLIVLKKIGTILSELQLLMKFKTRSKDFYKSKQFFLDAFHDKLDASFLLEQEHIWVDGISNYAKQIIALSLSKDMAKQSHVLEMTKYLGATGLLDFD